jgi:GDP-L-fucose synthase
VRRLEREPIAELITATSDEVDLTDQAATTRSSRRPRPDVAILAAARVGGIHANRTRRGSSCTTT